MVAIRRSTSASSRGVRVNLLVCRGRERENLRGGLGDGSISLSAAARVKHRTSFRPRGSPPTLGPPLADRTVRTWTYSLELGACGSDSEAKFLAAAARETTSDRFLGKCWKRLRCLCFERMPARRRARDHHVPLSTSFKDEWVSKLQTRSEGRSRDHATCREACFGGRPLGNGPTRRPSACAMSFLNSSRPSAHPPFVAARSAMMNSSSSFTSHRA